jgi:hypothetical protein
MARYFFHIKDGGHLVRDEEGTDLAGPDHARAHALQSARELCADAIKSGRDLDADAFVIADEQGQSLTFRPGGRGAAEAPAGSPALISGCNRTSAVVSARRGFTGREWVDTPGPA